MDNDSVQGAFYAVRGGEDTVMRAGEIMRFALKDGVVLSIGGKKN